MHVRSKRLYAFISAVSLLASCTGDPPTSSRGQLVDREVVLALSVAEVEELVAAVGLGEIVQPVHGLVFHRLTYLTPDVDGTETEASGLVVVPDGEGPFPMLSDQHGTQAQRHEVMSDPFRQSELGIVALFFASEGWVVTGADYLGLGVSRGVHPYYHAATEASASVDMLRAVQQVLADDGVSLTGELFLSGYSQGAHVTMALHRELDLEPLDGLEVVASAPMAGAHALADVSVPSALTTPSPSSAFYLAYAVVAYDRVYDLYEDPVEVFRSPHAATVEALFDGTRPIEAIVASLPATPAELFHAEFVDEVLADAAHPFRQLLRENEVLDWTPAAPVTLYHGGGDVDVPFASSAAAFEVLRARGADVRLVNLGDDVDHAAGGLPAYLSARAWFDTLLR